MQMMKTNPMQKLPLALLTAVIAVAPISIPAQEPDDANIFGRDPRLERILTAIEQLQTHDSAAEAARTRKYIEDLKALEEEVAASGELDHVLQIRNEREAREAGKPTKPIDPKDQSIVLGLRKLRYYFEREVKALREGDEGVAQSGKQQLIAELATLERTLTAEGKIEDAKAARRAREHLEKGTTSSSASQTDEDWIVLFDGKTLENWIPTPPGKRHFFVRDNSIVASGSGGMLTCGSFELVGDFEFQAEVKMEEGTNSGVFLHTNRSGQSEKGAQLEVAIAGDAKNAGPNGFFTGAIYGAQGIADPGLAIGEWFVFNIQREAERVVTRINGEVVLDFDTSSQRQTSKLSGGYLSLQARSQRGAVHFRNLKIRKFSKLTNSANSASTIPAGFSSASPNRISGLPTNDRAPEFLGEAWSSRPLSGNWRWVSQANGEGVKKHRGPLDVFGESAWVEARHRDSKLVEIRATYLEAGFFMGAAKGQVDPDAPKVDPSKSWNERKEEFDARFGELGDSLVPTLSKALGKPKNISIGRGDLRKRILQFQSGDLLVNLDMQERHLIAVVIQPAELFNRLMRVEGETLSSSAAARENVEKLENGDVRIRNIPMVEQGSRGYCAMGTLSMITRYYGLNLDIDSLAAAGGYTEGDTKAPIGNIYSEAAKLARLRYDHSRKFDFRETKRAINRGQPILVWRLLGENRTRAHASLITGYNDKEETVFFTESWSNKYRHNPAPVELAEERIYSIFTFTP